MSLTEDQKRVLNEAKRLEAERIEIYAQAVEQNCADLLPASFSDFDAQMEDPVEVRLELGLTENDVQRMDERELRSLLGFIGAQADRARAERNYLESQDEDD